MVEAPLARVVPSIREFFSLEAAETRARALPPDLRESTARTLARAWQKRDAAETLFPRGCRAEAVRLAREGFALAEEAINELARAGDDGPDAAQRTALARTQVERLAGVELDSDVTHAHADALRILLDEMVALERHTSRVVAGPRDIAAARGRRRFWTIAVAAMAITVCALAIHAAHTLHVTASGIYSATYPATNAVDGRTDTEWLMPDKVQAGWLDVALGGSRTVTSVRLTNGHNPPHNERAIRDFQLTCFDGTRLVKTVSGNFAFSEHPQRTAFDFGVVKCDRIRLDVTSVWSNGGALAEIDVP